MDNLTNQNNSEYYMSFSNILRRDQTNKPSFQTNQLQQHDQRFTDFLQYLTNFFKQIVQTMHNMKLQLYKMIGIQASPQMNLLITFNQIQPQMISIIDSSKNCLQDMRRIEAMMKGYIIGRDSVFHHQLQNNQSNQDDSLEIQPKKNINQADPYTFYNARNSQTGDYDRKSVQKDNKTDFNVAYLNSNNILPENNKINLKLNNETYNQSQAIFQQDYFLFEENQKLKKQLDYLTHLLYLKIEQKQQKQYKNVKKDINELKINYQNSKNSQFKKDQQCLDLINLIKKQLNSSN